MTKIIIQGAGIVGQATEKFLNMACPTAEITFNDPFKGKDAKDADFEQAEWFIVCVNTDLNVELRNPENNVKNVDDSINEALRKGFKGRVVVRSTLSLNAIKNYMDQLGQNLLVWPEYIREATWAEDAVTPRYITLGGEPAEEFSNLLTGYKGSSFITDPLEAMLAKLSTNTFLAMKVVFANQVALLSKHYGASYDIVKVLLESEGRLGTSHWTVPGADGKYGFSGKCFPKDIKTFEAELIRAGLFVDVIRGVSDINEELRNLNDEPQAT